MSEILPDPTLPIFGGKSVFYNVIQQRDNRLNPAWETVRIPVDQIDTIDNQQLREALWEQFGAEETASDQVILPFVHADGRFSHAFSIYREPLGVTFTEDGVIENNELAAYREAKLQERQAEEQKAGSWLTRLFNR